MVNLNQEPQFLLFLEYKKLRQMRFNYDAVKNSWEVFNKAYMPELSESEYMSFIEDVASVVDFSDKYYPQILFPKSFLDLISCRFETVTKNPLKTRIKILALKVLLKIIRKVILKRMIV